jgi:hypothetical protein
MRVITLLPGTAQAMQRDANAKSRGLDDELPVTADDVNVRTAEARNVHAVAARFGHIIRAGCDRPARRTRDGAVSEQQQSRDVFFEHEQVRDCSGIGRQRQPAADLLGKCEQRRIG